MPDKIEQQAAVLKEVLDGAFPEADSELIQKIMTDAIEAADQRETALWEKIIRENSPRKD